MKQRYNAKNHKWISVDLDKNLVEQFVLKFKGDNIISKAEFIWRSIKKYLDDKWIKKEGRHFLCLPSFCQYH